MVLPVIYIVGDLNNYLEQTTSQLSTCAKIKTEAVASVFGDVPAGVSVSACAPEDPTVPPASLGQIQFVSHGIKKWLSGWGKAKTVVCVVGALLRTRASERANPDPPAQVQLQRCLPDERLLRYALFTCKVQITASFHSTL